MANQRTYRKFSAKPKLEIVLAGLRGDRSVLPTAWRPISIPPGNLTVVIRESTSRAYFGAAAAKEWAISSATRRRSSR